MASSVITYFNCKSCGPQDLIGDFGSRTHVLCLKCGEEIELKAQETKK